MPDEPDDPVWLTAAETADYLKVSRRTLQRLRVPGENGPPFHGVGRRLRYDRREVDSWLRGGGGTSPHPTGDALLYLHGPLQGATWADFADDPEHAGGPMEPDPDDYDPKLRAVPDSSARSRAEHPAATGRPLPDPDGMTTATVRTRRPGGYVLVDVLGQAWTIGDGGRWIAADDAHVAAAREALQRFARAR